VREEERSLQSGTAEQKDGNSRTAPKNETTHTATGTNRVVRVHRPRGKGAADGGREVGQQMAKGRRRLMRRKRRQRGRRGRS